jgi:electron transport complex protein RnfA
VIDVLVLIFGAILINNFVLVRFLGICPFLGVSKQVDTALGMGFAVTFVMGIASGCTYLVQEKLLEPLHLEVLQTLTFILVIAVLVQFVEILLKKVSPALYQALGIYLPLITTNCAVLGVALINFNNNYNFILSVIHGIAAALGFTLGIVLFAGIREQMANAPIPKALQGFPIALLTAGLMSIVFLGFSGLNLTAFFEYFAKWDWNSYQAYLVNLFK